MARPCTTMIIGLSALAAIACSSGGDDLPTATARVPTPVTAPDTALPIATVRSGDSTESPAPISDNAEPRTGIEVTATTPVGDDEPSPPPEPVVDLGTLTVPVCRTTLATSSPDGFGTVPHATATPISQSGESGGPRIDHATAFVTRMRPLYDALNSVVVAGDDAWSSAVTEQSRAGSLAFEGRRLSYLCAALSITPTAADSAPLFSQLAGAMEARRGVLSDAVELLRSSGAVFTANEVERERTALDILSFGSALEDFAMEFSVADSAGAQGYTVVNPLLDLNLNVPAGWVTVRNGIDVFITAPEEVQRYSVSGLGPEAWKLGTAIRVRRFRNETDRTLEEAVGSLDSLLVRFGSRIEEFDSAIGTEPGIRLTYANVDGYWRALVGATVVADETYLFELGCPIEFIDECEAALSAILTEVTFGAG